MSSNISVFDRVCKVIEQNNGYNGETKIDRSTSLAEDLEFDSLDTVDLWIDLDEEFAFSFSEEASYACKTVGEIVSVIEKEMEGVL